MKSDIITDSEDHISEAAVSGSATRLIKTGALLLVVRSGILARTIPVARAGRDLTINQDIKALTPSDRLDSQFLAHFLKSRERYLLDKVTRGATVHKLDTPVIKSLPIPLPPLDVQNRIVAVLDEAFEGLSRARANANANLADAREVYLRYLRSVFTKEGTGNRKTSVGGIVQLQRGFDITKSQQHAGTVPVVSSGGISSYHRDAMANGPGVVLGRKGSIGSVYFVEQDFWPHDTTLWVKDFKGNNPKLVFFLLTGLDLKRLDSGAANPSLNRNLVHPIEVFWPNVPEQAECLERIEGAFDATRSLEAAYKGRVSELSSLRQALLQKAFSGELT